MNSQSSQEEEEVDNLITENEWTQSMAEVTSEIKDGFSEEEVDALLKGITGEDNYPSFKEFLEHEIKNFEQLELEAEFELVRVRAKLDYAKQLVKILTTQYKEI